MKIDFTLLGKRIKEVRQRSKLTQLALADETDLSMQFISSIETGKKKVSLEALVNIAEVLGVTMDELLNGNQLSNPTEYLTDIDEVMATCSEDEKRFVYLNIDAIVGILRDNSWEIYHKKH